jgi:hypothetical protein
MTAGAPSPNMGIRFREITVPRMQEEAYPKRAFACRQGE